MTSSAKEIQTVQFKTGLLGRYAPRNEGSRAISSSRPAKFARQCGGFGESWILIGKTRQRRFLVHGGNGAIEPQTLCNTCEAPGLEHRVEGAIAPQQRSSALRAEAS